MTFPEPAAARPRKSKTRDIRLTVEIKAPPDNIYKALTSARELCRWWLAGAETDARNTGRLRLVWPKLKAADSGRSFPPHTAVGESEGFFVDLEPGRKVAWMWKLPRNKKNIPPLSSIFIRPHGRSCEVTLLHGGFPSRPSSAKFVDGCAQGWEDCLSKLKLYLETGRTCKNQALSFSALTELLKKK